MFAVNRTLYETSMLLQRATVDPNLRAFDQTTGRGTDKIRLNVKQAIRVQYDNKCAFCGVFRVRRDFRVLIWQAARGISLHTFPTQLPPSVRFSWREGHMS